MLDSTAQVGTVKKQVNNKINVDPEDAVAVQKMLDDIPDFDIKQK
jgi:hypothetical protein